MRINCTIALPIQIDLIQYQPSTPNGQSSLYSCHKHTAFITPRYIPITHPNPHPHLTRPTITRSIAHFWSPQHIRYNTCVCHPAHILAAPYVLYALRFAVLPMPPLLEPRQIAADTRTGTHTHAHTHTAAHSQLSTSKYAFYMRARAARSAHQRDHHTTSSVWHQLTPKRESFGPCFYSFVNHRKMVENVDVFTN